jgi:hypothetical protein
VLNLHRKFSGTNITSANINPSQERPSNKHNNTSCKPHLRMQCIARRGSQAQQPALPLRLASRAGPQSSKLICVQHEKPSRHSMLLLLIERSQQPKLGTVVHSTDKPTQALLQRKQLEPLLCGTAMTE